MMKTSLIKFSDSFFFSPDIGMYLVFLLYFFLSILLCSVSGFALSIGWVLYIPGGDTSFMFVQNFSL